MKNENDRYKVDMCPNMVKLPSMPNSPKNSKNVLAFYNTLTNF